MTANKIYSNLHQHQMLNAEPRRFWKGRELSITFFYIDKTVIGNVQSRRKKIEIVLIDC